jgi:hypothetical protein
MGKKKKRYSPEELVSAVSDYQQGKKMKEVKSKYPDVPERTIYLHAKHDRENIPIKRPGPPPVLTVAMENDLQAWIIGMQSHGYPISRDIALTKANAIYREMYGVTRSTGFLKRGWLERFMQRHPLLTFRTSQVIKRVRAEATEEGLLQFFWEVMKHVIERNLTSDQIFNMDETGFSNKNKTKNVIAVKGSRNVWSKSVEASAHLTVVGAASASGFVVPPLYIVPGQRLNRDVLDACSIFGSVVTVSAKGFMTSKVFLKWLSHFESVVPGTVKRPLLLIYDGYSSHYDCSIIERAIQLKVILVLLPANATHLIQPLDVAVFRGFKAVLKRKMESFMIENAVTTYSKKDSITLASSSWQHAVVNRQSNVISGFRTCGIWPLSFPSMQRRWLLYHNGGMDSKVQVEPWLEIRECVRKDLLSLPAPVDRKPKRRKTIDVNDRLLSREQLAQYDT